MDIRDKAVEETSRIDLVDANETPLVDDAGQPCFIVVYGPGSKQYASAQNKNQNRAFARLRKKGKVEQSVDERVRENAEFLADCTHSFSDNLRYGDLEGRELHIAVYSEQGIGFIAEQVSRHLSDWANFTKARAPS